MSGLKIRFPVCLIVFVLFFVSAADSYGFRERLSSQVIEVSESDVKAEIQFGREVAARVLGKYGQYENDKLAKYVNLVGKTVAMQTARPEIEFRFAVLKTDSINAYAAPGGYVFITKGALMQMQNEAELAAVLAHEIAHITGKHIVRELNIHGADDSPVSGFARLLGASGDPAKVAFLQTVDKALEILFESGYEIQDEKEADRNGTIYLALAGYDPQALISYFNKVNEKKGERLSVLRKTHPSFVNRINLINALLKEEGLDELQDHKKGAERFNAILEKL